MSMPLEHFAKRPYFLNVLKLLKSNLANPTDTVYSVYLKTHNCIVK